MPDPEIQQLTDDWLRYAEGDLRHAEGMLVARESHQPRHVCFAAQQATEKALKAVLVARQVDFPFNHDLQELAALLEAEDAVRRAAGGLAWLTQWAVAPRYPGDVEPQWDDAERAVEEARPVVQAALEALG